MAFRLNLLRRCGTQSQAALRSCRVASGGVDPICHAAQSGVGAGLRTGSVKFIRLQVEAMRLDFVLKSVPLQIVGRLLAVLLIVNLSASLAFAQECDCLSDECVCGRNGPGDRWQESSGSVWPFSSLRRSPRTGRVQDGPHAHRGRHPDEELVTVEDAGVWEDHAGLLGKRYVAASYIQLNHGDAILDLFDEDFEGWGVTLNIPVWRPHHASWLGADVFASWNALNLGGAVQFPAPVPVGVQLDTDISNTAVGTSLYADWMSPIRPFVQLGATFHRDRTLILIDGFGGVNVERDTDFLLAAGLECDLTEWLSFRALFDIETEDALGDSLFRGDLIAWPTERVFVRGGGRSCRWKARQLAAYSASA